MAAREEDIAVIGAVREALPEDQRELLRTDIEKMVSSEKSPLISRLLTENVDLITDLVEAVNANTKMGYGGLIGDGRELTAQWITPADFGKSEWDRTRASGVESFISGTTAENEGFLILGWMNQEEKPVANKVKFYKGTEETVVEPLSFRGRERFDAGESPIIQQRKALIVPPETNYEVEDSASVSGADALQPIGIYVKTAEDAWSL